MTQHSDVYEKNYDDYRAQIAKVDFESVKETLGLEKDGDKFLVWFANDQYTIEDAHILDEQGNRPHYTICVVLFQYILLCPKMAPHYDDWISFKDFKQTSHMGNTNFFSSGTELAIQKAFSGRLEALVSACEKMGAYQSKDDMPYDLAVQIDMLPQISLLLLFNDKDEEFPAQCKVLFQKHTEYFLDPESIIIASSLVANKLVQLAKEITI